jgi:hypothetical protein
VVFPALLCGGTVTLGPSMSTAHPVPGESGEQPAFDVVDVLETDLGGHVRCVCHGHLLVSFHAVKGRG